MQGYRFPPPLQAPLDPSLPLPLPQVILDPLTRCSAPSAPLPDAPQAGDGGASSQAELSTYFCLPPQPTSKNPVKQGFLFSVDHTLCTLVLQNQVPTFQPQPPHCSLHTRLHVFSVHEVVSSPRVEKMMDLFLICSRTEPSLK